MHTVSSASEHSTLLIITNNGTARTIYHFDSLNEFDDNAEALLTFTTLYTPNIDRCVKVKSVDQH
jgi:predicted metal-binding protein